MEKGMVDNPLSLGFGVVCCCCCYFSFLCDVATSDGTQLWDQPLFPCRSEHFHQAATNFHCHHPGLDCSFWKRSQRLMSVLWAPQTHAHTEAKGRVVCKAKVPMLCRRETWRELRPSDHQCLQNHNQHATAELINEQMGNHVLKGFAGAEEHSKAAFKKQKANVPTYSKTFWKEWILWTAGKNRRPVFDINLRGREDEDYSVCPWKEGRN